jgi:hypothetical protein
MFIYLKANLFDDLFYILKEILNLAICCYNILVMEFFRVLHRGSPLLLRGGQCRRRSEELRARVARSLPLPPARRRGAGKAAARSSVVGPSTSPVAALHRPRSTTLGSRRRCGSERLLRRLPSARLLCSAVELLPGGRCRQGLPRSPEQRRPPLPSRRSRGSHQNHCRDLDLSCSKAQS